jgi:hypothetical protein
MAFPVPFAPLVACRSTLDAIRHSARPLQRGFSVCILPPDASTGLKRAQIVQADGTIWKTLTYGPEATGDPAR